MKRLDRATASGILSHHEVTAAHAARFQFME